MYFDLPGVILSDLIADLISGFVDFFSFLF